MNQIIEQIELEIERLNAAKALLQGSQERPKRTMSPKARKAIAAAQKRRWETFHKKHQPTKVA